MRPLAAVLLLALAACAPQTGDVDRTVTVEVGGVERSLELFVPGDAVPPVPLVVVFHGFTSNAAAVREASGFDEIARALGFAVAYPQALGVLPSWRSDPRRGDADLDFFAALVDAVDAIVPVQRSAVVVAGFSNGGGMAVRIGCERSDLVVGVGAVAAAIPEPGCVPPEGVALVAFHGLSDPIVPFAGAPGLVGAEEWVRAWASANGCGPGAAGPVADGVDRVAYADCAAPVGLYRIAGGGHGWPGPGPQPWWGRTTTAVDASALIAALLAR